MNFKRIAILSVLLVLASGFASSALISNSESWKDNSLVIARSHFEDKQVHAVTSLSEGQLIEEMIRSDQEHTVYEPEDPDRAVWENYANFLRNEDQENVQASFIKWQDSQYDFYNDLQSDVDGVVVVKPGFAMDTISIFPQIINQNYWPIYYNGDDTDQFLKNMDSEDDVIFYGQNLKQPWRHLDENQNYSIVSEGSNEENNRELVRKITRENDRESAVVAADNYLEKGFMKKGDPILIARDIDEAASLLNDLDFTSIEIIGGENVQYGNDLQDRIDENTTVIAKFGRRFTGAPGLDSTYPIKQIPATPLIRSVSVESVKYAEDTGTAEVVFKNEGTIETPVTFSAISLSSGVREEITSQDLEVVMRPDRNTTVDLNVSTPFTPETAEVSFGYEGSSGVASRTFDVNNTDSWESSDVTVEDAYYYEPDEQIRVDITNQGEETVYADAQLMDLELLNRTVQPVTEDIVEIEPGDKGTVGIDAYMSEQAIENNNPVNVAVTVGDSRHTTKDLKQFESVQLEVREGGIVLIIIQYGPILLILLLILALLYYLKKRREEEKYRGLK